MRTKMIVDSPPSLKKINNNNNNNLPLFRPKTALPELAGCACVALEAFSCRGVGLVVVRVAGDARAAVSPSTALALMALGAGAALCADRHGRVTLLEVALGAC